MNDYLSRKFKVISFLSMFLVVLIHCDNGTISQCDVRLIETVGTANTFFELFIRLGLTLIAVPFFFIISGYLFFRNIDGSWQGFKSKYKSRFNSLFIPYVYWNLFWALIILLFNEIDSQFYTRTQSLNSFKDVITISSLKNIVGCFIRSCPDSPLWYVRDLIILVLFSPIIYKLTNKFKSPFLLLALSLLYFAGLVIIPLKYPYFGGFILSGNFVLSLFFFSVGAYLSICGKDILLKKWNDGKLSLSWGVAWLFFLLLKVVLVCHDVEPFISSTVSRISILLGLVFSWVFYDYIVQKYDFHHLNRLLPYSFFVYVFHFLIVKYIFLIIGDNPMLQLLNGIITPVLVVGFSIGIASFIKRFSPKIYSIITGNR